MCPSGVETGVEIGERWELGNSENDLEGGWLCFRSWI